MNYREFFLGSSDFKSADEIIRLVAEYPSILPQEDLTGAEALLIFQTSKQQTWFVAGTRGLYCVLDDLNKSFTRVQWMIPFDRLITDGKKILSLATHDYTERTGLLDIGDRHNWLFSKKLFTNEDIKTSINKLIVPRMMFSV
jgi:hypothetical protein